MRTARRRSAFACCIAISASRVTSSARSYDDEPTAMPMLALMKTEREPIWIDLERLFRMRRAIGFDVDDVAKRGQQHGKLIAPQSRHDIARIDRRAQAPRDLREDDVACRMPERFIDLFEMLEVDKEDREERVQQGTGFRESPAQTVFEQGTVRSPVSPSCVLLCWIRRSLCLSSVLSRNMQMAKRARLFSSLTIDTVASVQTSWPDAERACCSYSNVSRSAAHSDSSSSACPSIAVTRVSPNIVR